MSERTTPEALITETEVRASAARIFEALSDPAQRLAWWGSKGKFQAEHMESDLRPGGLWVMRGTGPGGQAFSIRGEYRVVDPPHVLEFTWNPDWPEPTSIIRFELNEMNGVTAVRLTHSGFNTPDIRSRYQGWPLLLANLRNVSTQPNGRESRMTRLFPAEQTRSRKIFYWTSTALVVFGMTLGGIGDVLRVQPIIEGMAKLGYPSYFPIIIGVWKLLGAPVLLAPALPRLKEWAYAVAFFNFSGAVISHLAVGDTPAQIAPSLVFSILTLVSWALRPPTRRLTQVDQR